MYMFLSIMLDEHKFAGDKEWFLAGSYSMKNESTHDYKLTVFCT